MGSQSDIQRLQTACQELLKKKGAFSGFLRRKTILHKLLEGGIADKLTSSISWQRRYFVVHDGFLYNYKSETDNRPTKVIDLCAFQRVEKDENLKAKGVAWPLKISSDIPNVKIMHFGATSESELKKWIAVVKKGIDEAKESGRKFFTIEKTKTNIRKKRQSQHNEEDDDDDNDGVYTATEPEDYYQSGSDYTSMDDQGNDSSSDDEPTVPGKPHETKPSLPQPPDTNHGPAKDNSAAKKPAAPSKSNSQPDSARKPLASPRIKPESNVGKKPLPKEQEAVDLIGEATWTGSPEKAIETMKAIDEDGVFMLRESTAGNGELTLQVISDDAVRKYRITKEGKQFRMTDGNTFDSMAELLSFYQKNSIPNHSTKLTKPYSRV